MEQRKTMGGKSGGTPALAVSAGLRVVVFSLAWWALAEGRFDEEPFFIGFIVAVTVAVSFPVFPPGSWPIRGGGALRFVPWFFWNSLQGGFDVARRAFHRRIPLQTDIVEFRLKGSEKQAFLFAWIVSLLPGTACISISGTTMKIHVLDTRLPIHEKMKELQQRISRFCD